jgi:hypothetical protein
VHQSSEDTDSGAANEQIDEHWQRRVPDAVVVAARVVPEGMVRLQRRPKQDCRERHHHDESETSAVRELHRCEMKNGVCSRTYRDNPQMRSSPLVDEYARTR